MTDLDAILASYPGLVNDALERYLTPPRPVPTRLWEAMRYSVMAGGKRVRPITLMLAAEACGGSAQIALPPACAVEMVHTYSLIHDDLPAMDDDRLRRGKPTCHTVFGEAVAILAGDALHDLAFGVIADADGRTYDDATAARLVQVLADGIGPLGVAIGQAADLDAEGADGDAEQLAFIHLHKTAALFRACAVMGGVVAGASETHLAALARYGEKTGLAFQVVDDILDVTAGGEALGKTPGKDAAAGKLTVPRVRGLEGARAEAARLTTQAVGALSPLGDRAAALAGLTRRMLERCS